MSREFLKVDQQSTVGIVIDKIRTQRAKYQNETFVYVVDKSDMLVGQLLIRDLFLEDSHTMLADLCNEQPIDFSETEDIEDVLNSFKKYNLIEASITLNGKITGVISYEQIYRISVEEFTEDFQRIAGIEPIKQNYLNTSVGKIVKARIV